MRRPLQHPLLSSLLLCLSGVAVALGCASEPAPVVETSKPAKPASSASPAVSTAEAVTPSAAASAPKAPAALLFENPGGMWTPSQMKEQSATLKSLGLEIDAAALSDPTTFPLGAVISLGGCTASFISPDGLVITNHHCATRALQFNSTPDKNLLRDGYLAKTRAEEKSNGPTSRVFVTQSFRDVTAEVRAGVEKISSDVDRFKKMEARTKQIIAACEKDRPSIRCSVSAFYRGAQYTLIEQLEIRDVRIVYAPPEGVGNFGGEIDNWRWPRHSGDFSIYRAYVGKDGKPADYAQDNVPYRPPHYLKIAQQPLRAGDFVMVAGYPGQTNRIRTGLEVSEAAAWRYPRAIKLYEEAIALLEGLSKDSPERALKARPLIRGLNNARTKFQGIEEGLVKGGLAAQTTKKEADLRAFIDADKERKAAYGDVLDKMTALLAEQKKTREGDAALSEALNLAKLLGSASIIVRMAEERPKKDEDREPELQERNWRRIEQEQSAMQKSYDRTVERSILKLLLVRMAKLPAKERSPLLALVVGKGEPTEDAIDKALDAIYSGTKLEDADARIALFKTAKTADLKKSKDPLIKLALELRPTQKAIERRDDAFLGAMALLAPRYIEALQKSSKTPLAPDANGTLRVTYGTVRSYSPAPGAPEYKPFTVVSEMVKKSTGKEPFAAPPRVLDAVKAKRFGPYVDAALGEVPVDFLSDLDITGGNSGSPTLNARGELVGLAFDGNYESMASDWLFIPSITRTIHVDIRYALWLLDAVEGADDILKEMGVTPSVRK